MIELNENSWNFFILSDIFFYTLLFKEIPLWYMHSMLCMYTRFIIKYCAKMWRNFSCLYYPITWLESYFVFFFYLRFWWKDRLLKLSLKIYSYRWRCVYDVTRKRLQDLCAQSTRPEYIFNTLSFESTISFN